MAAVLARSGEYMTEMAKLSGSAGGQCREVRSRKNGTGSKRLGGVGGTGGESPACRGNPNCR